jgi:hypothetical protein
MFTQAMQTGSFEVDVATSNNGGHPPEFWAEQAAKKIISVADTAPDVIKSQAIAFQNHVEQVVLYYMKCAIDCDRSTVSYMVTEAGHPQLAEIIRRP